MALEPMFMEDDTLVGFYPPSLGSLWVDTLKKSGELENISLFVRDGETAEIRPKTEEETEAMQYQSDESNNGDELYPQIVGLSNRLSASPPVSLP